MTSDAATVLTVQEAFEALYVFLERHAEMTQSKEFADLIVDLGHIPSRVLPVTTTPGYWEDWLEAVSIARQRLEGQ